MMFRSIFKHLIDPNPLTITKLELPFIRLCIMFSALCILLNEFIFEDHKTALMCIAANLMFGISYLINLQLSKYIEYIAVSRY